MPNKFFTTFFIGFSVLAILNSCNHRMIYNEVTEIEDHVWFSERKVMNEVNIEDTLQQTDVYLLVRNASCYPYSNIILFVNTTFPDGRSSRDTVECILADETGKWLGSGLGDIWDNEILYRKNVRFPQRGIYKIELTHAMRKDPLPCVMDVGIAVKKR